MSAPRVRGHRIAGPVVRRSHVRHYGADVATIAAIVGSAAAVAGTGVSVYAAYSQGEQQQQAQKYNAKIAQNQALAAQQAASVQEAQVRQRNQRVQASARAALGESGITDEGSPLLVLMDNAKEAELEARLVRSQGERAGAGFMDQAALHTFAGRQAGQAGMLRAGTTLLTGAAGFARGVSGWPSSTPGLGYGSIRPQDLGNGLPY